MFDVLESDSAVAFPAVTGTRRSANFISANAKGLAGSTPSAAEAAVVGLIFEPACKREFAFPLTGAAGPGKFGCGKCSWLIALDFAETIIFPLALAEEAATEPSLDNLLAGDAGVSI